MKLFGLVFLVIIALSSPLPGLAGDLCAADDSDHKVCLSAPAERVVSLSPGATELLFSAGAGEKLVAVSAWSDYPPEAAELPQVGNSNRLDLEAIVAQEPDLVVAWGDGNSASQLAKIEALGVPVFWLKPRTFEDIASAVKRLAVLSGNEKAGANRAADFLAGIEQLRDRYQKARPVRVFYQVWHEPLMTINDKELIGRAISLCGGSNVFGHLPRLVPRISEEAVLETNPDAILSGGEDSDDRRWLEQWRQYPELAAVSKDNLYLIPPSLIQRPTLRMLEGTRQLCQTLEQDRARL